MDDEKKKFNLEKKFKEIKKVLSVQISFWMIFVI